VDQAVPLTGALSVELDLVVEAVEFEGAILEVEDFVHETFAAEAGGIDSAERPIERDGCTVGCFLQRILYDLGSKEIEAAEVVFLAILVEETPGAACWHALNGREGVEVGEVGVVGDLVDSEFSLPGTGRRDAGQGEGEDGL